MRTDSTSIGVRNSRSFRVRALATAMGLAIGLWGAGARAQTNWTIVGWNNLGMHCADADFSVFCTLPPYNTINAQVVDANGALVGADNGVTVTYAAVADATGSINTTSYLKWNFWKYAQALFGVVVQPDVGLPVPGPESYAMPGKNNVPQAMAYATSAQWYEAYGIPLSPYDDAGRTNTYPMMRLVARNASGGVVSTADIVLPISAELNCRACHGSGSAPGAQPADGWVYDPNTQRDFRLNILRLHDDRQLGTPAFATALANNHYNSAGLYATVVSSGTPILCAACHLSEALPGTGQPGIPPLTESIHGTHATAVDPANGMLLGSSVNRTACYYCHPGRSTKCLRGVMGRAVAPDGQLEMQCQNCHGAMSYVARAGRTGWLDEPNCQACHSGDAVNNAGAIRYTSVFDANGVMRVPSNQRFATTPDVPSSGFNLYRFSRGHGGLYCEACHNSTHAEFPSADTNDNVVCVERQGHVGMLSECTACHGTTPNTTTGGPHGLHPLGQPWVSMHQDAGSRSTCQVCHGTDYRGTVLSRSRADRTLGAFGTKTFWRGFQIGCYTCHNGPGSDSRNSNSPAAVQNRTASTTVGMSVAIPLTATDANGDTLTLRVVSQAQHGTVGLSGTVATYFPDPDFSGNDSFTFAAWDGSTDSNLGKVTLTVGGGGGGCSYAIAPATALVTADAGSGSITVNTTAGCAWTASSSATWITIASGASGTGPGTVTYNYTANTGPASRNGALSVAGQAFQLTQAGVTCTYTLSPTQAAFTSAAGSGTVAVNTSPGCPWTATSAVPWVTIVSGASGTGPSTVTYSVAANPSTQGRSTTLSIAGLAFMVTQDGLPCTYTITPTSASVSAAAGNGTVTVTAGAGCAWTATSAAPWVTITSGASGIGSGSVAYAVAANTSTQGRSTTLTIAGATLTLAQAGMPCTYAITPTSAAVAAAAGNGTVTVNTSAGCTWSAASAAPWVTIASGSNGSGPGTVTYAVAANTGTQGRSTTLTIAGLAFTVNQAGLPCTYTIAPTSATVPSVGGTGTVTVNTSPDCKWTATSAAPWLTISSGASGTGPGTVTYAVAANTSTQGRSTTLTIAGLTFALTQAGLPCNYTIAPTSAAAPASAGMGTVIVNTSVGCEWAATSAAPWISIVSGASGTGSGTVTYALAANTSTQGRSTTLTIAGLTFTLTQAGLACAYTIAPSSAAFGPAAGNGVVSVTAAAGCAWTVNNNVAWITLVSGASGSGPGAVAYAVAANTGSARTATLTIAGQTFTVSQAGPSGGCTYAISPTSARFSSSGGNGAVRVGTGPTCRWTARSAVAWITITSSGGEKERESFRSNLSSEASGIGSGSVQYSVARNTDRRSRTGAMTIADKTFTVYQTGARAEYGSTHGAAFGNVSVNDTLASQRLTAELVMENEGAEVTPAVRPAIYLSDSGTLDRAATLLWTRNVQGLEPSESRVSKFRLSLPGKGAAHGKYLIAVMNPEGVLKVSNEPPLVYGPID